MMRGFLKILKWFFIVIFVVLVSGVLFVRFTRQTDKFIYQTSNTYENFESDFDHREMFIPMEDGTKIHAALFKPENQPIGTIFHHLGNGMTMINAQRQYEPLIKRGFQIFAYERRGFAKSTGEDNNSKLLKEDALEVFDAFLELEEVKDTDVIVWGQSLGGAYATMNAAERQENINGLIVEGTFTSFPDMGKVYAHVLNMENFTWLIPLLMNNDFPAEEKISQLEKPVVVIHSSEDDQVPYELGRKLFAAADKSNARFWKVEGGHIDGIRNHQEEYVQNFVEMLN